jgi:hypothetical protein
MKPTDKRLALLTFFAIFGLASVVTTYVIHQLPTQETTTDTLCSYSSSATYDYTAMLEPNVVYSNRTILKPNEGTIYSALTRQINITLSYSFQATLPAIVETTYSIDQNLKVAAWQHTTSTTPQMTTSQTQTEIELMPFNRTELEAVKAQVEAETGAVSGTYSLEISPTFIINANTSAGPIHQIFTPVLTINVGRTDQGNTITIENLQQTETGAMTQDNVSPRNDVIIERRISYVFVSITMVGLSFSAYYYTKAQKRTGQSPIVKLIAPYKDLIVKTKETPQTPQGIMVIDVENLEELAKTAEILARPILHATNGNEHLFYIIEANTKYQYRIPEEKT